MKTILINLYRCSPSLSFMILEMGVSGYYTPIDALWIFTRVGIVIGFILLAISKNYKALSWGVIVIIPLTMLSARAEWEKIASEKLTKMQSLEQTRIKEPVNPVLPDCSNLTKWRKEICDSRLEKLQSQYIDSLQRYNSAISKSENKIKSIEVELTWIESQPIFIYILFSCTLSFMTMICLPTQKNSKQIVPIKKRLGNDLKFITVQRILKEKKRFPKKSYETICNENGTSYKNFVRWSNGNVRTNVLKGLEQIQEENENV